MNTQWSAMVYATFALGALAVYLLLPRTGRSTRTAGAILGVAALAAAMVLCAGKFLGTGGGNGFFYVSAVVAVVSAVKVITHEKPVYSALYFVLTVLAVAPLLILQEAEFLAVALVIIYAGAILVTYVFVIMLSQQGGAALHDRQSRRPLAAVFGGFLTMAVIAGQMAVLPEEQAVVGELAASRVRWAATVSSRATVRMTADTPTDGRRPADAQQDDDGGDNTARVGRVMMTDYVVAFEMAGVLLLVAMVGAIAISKKRVPAEGTLPPGRSPGQVGREVEPF